MTRKSWRRKSFIGLLIAAALAVPGAASAAAPSITSAEVFGNVRPGEQGWDHPTTGSHTLYATSRPFGSRYDMGQLYVRGNATGDLEVNGNLLLFIDIVVTDGVLSVNRTVTAQHVNDPEIGRAQGDFTAEIPVTQLGVHKATGVPGTTVDPAEWGPSTLTVTITPRTKGNVSGAPAVRAITKYAGTPKDTYAPAFEGGIVWPPKHWCHTSSEGAREPIQQSRDLGGDRYGNCGNLNDDNLGALPDATWVACVNATPGFDYQSSLPGRSRFCRPGAIMPTGSARVSGSVNDYNAPGAQGIASEIGETIIRITRGTDLIREYKDATGYRIGPKGGWGITLNINDFEPNPPVTGLPPYKITVLVSDAWGNTITTESPNIRVYPY